MAWAGACVDLGFFDTDGCVSKLIGHSACKNPFPLIPKGQLCFQKVMPTDRFRSEQAKEENCWDWLVQNNLDNGY